MSYEPMVFLKLSKNQCRYLIGVLNNSKEEMLNLIRSNFGHGEFTKFIFNNDQSRLLNDFEYKLYNTIMKQANVSLLDTEELIYNLIEYNTQVKLTAKNGSVFKIRIIEDEVQVVRKECGIKYKFDKKELQSILDK